MTAILRSFAVLMLVAFAFQTDAGVRISAPGAGVGVLHQQTTVKLEEEDEEEEDEEPGCE